MIEIKLHTVVLQYLHVLTNLLQDMIPKVTCTERLFNQAESNQTGTNLIVYKSDIIFQISVC